MSGHVLLVGGTHGNEVNAPWLLRRWQQMGGPPLPAETSLAVTCAIGNPAALAAGRRYLDRDLNRCFRHELLGDPDLCELEVLRARELLNHYGPGGSEPQAVVIDLHSTTAAMGSSLVLYGRRPADLALAAACQFRLGLPVYLHEGDPVESGFLISLWPCGLVLEVGPVAQGVLCPHTLRRTELGVQTLLELLQEAAAGRLRLPEQLRVHRHIANRDLPRSSDGTPRASVHPDRLRSDWLPIAAGDPLFLGPEGPIPLEEGTPGRLATLFANEAAYGEKGIALAVVEQLSLRCLSSWSEALRDVLTGSLASGTVASGTVARSDHPPA
jgi:aspartoacylase